MRDFHLVVQMYPSCSQYVYRIESPHLSPELHYFPLFPEIIRKLIIMFMPAIPRDSLLSYQSITAKHDRPVRFLAAYMYAAIIRSTITKAET
jgi:hypothetical protein